MIISHKYKFIFTRVAKTASSSLMGWQGGPLRPATTTPEQKRPIPDFVNASSWKHISEKYGCEDKNHIPLKVAKDYLSKPVYNNYFKFGFCRDPLKRLVSAFIYGTTHAIDVSDWASSRRITPPSFESWFTEYYYPTHGLHGKYGLQCYYLDGCDYVGRVDSIEEDYKHICSKVCLPVKKLIKANMSIKYNYKDFYSKDFRSYIEDLYKPDFEFIESLPRG
jgi:hypothetical protein